MQEEKLRKSTEQIPQIIELGRLRMRPRRWKTRSQRTLKARLRSIEVSSREWAMGRQRKEPRIRFEFQTDYSVSGVQKK